MYQNIWIENLKNAVINQAMMNKLQQWKPLPPDQKEAIDHMLDCVHELFEYKRKIRPEYQSQALDAIVLRFAMEMKKNPE